MTQELRDDNGAPEALLAADGSPRLPHVAYDDDGYPFADDQPLSQNLPQSNQLYYAYPALKSLLCERFSDAFAASDMLIYPHKNDLAASVAPDIFVAFGASDDIRNSYKLWEGEPVPSFVLEVLSGSTADKDLGEKRDKYAAMGVTEFWVFDPSGDRIAGHIAGSRLRDGVYEPIAPLPDTRIHPSDVLGLEFRAEGDDLRIFDPKTGEDLVGHKEALDGRQEERAARIAAESREHAATLAQQEERDARIAEALARQKAEERAAAATLARQEERDARIAAESREHAATVAQQEERDARIAEALARQEAEERAAAAAAEVERLRRMLRDQDQ